MTAIIWSMIASKYLALRRSGKARKQAMLIMKEKFDVSRATVDRCVARERRREMKAGKNRLKLSQDFHCHKKTGLLN
ncbi:MAG TPA: hypothetical protein DCM05_09055 [Elusimicrobia bacterium]|nr:hypothetical protein [Elusimicrobiota bacterium]